MVFFHRRDRGFEVCASSAGGEKGDEDARGEQKSERRRRERGESKWREVVEPSSVDGNALIAFKHTGLIKSPIKFGRLFSPLRTGAFWPIPCLDITTVLSHPPREHQGRSSFRRRESVIGRDAEIVARLSLSDAKKVFPLVRWEASIRPLPSATRDTSDCLFFVAKSKKNLPRGVLCSDSEDADRKRERTTRKEPFSLPLSLSREK